MNVSFYYISGIVLVRLKHVEGKEREVRYRTKRGAEARLPVHMARLGRVMFDAKRWFGAAKTGKWKV